MNLSGKDFKSIKDPVHGYIQIFKEDEQILNTVYFERLHQIHQLGTTYLIYPSATHTRFEHSLGVMNLGTAVFESILSTYPKFWSKVKTKKCKIFKNTIRWACLLHDIGHLPFSHICESFVDLEQLCKKWKEKGYKVYNSETSTSQILTTGSRHELLSCLLVLEKYDKILTEHKVDPHIVCGLILGKISEHAVESKEYYNVLGGILNSNIDVDKLDYILRDNYTTGASLVGIDKDRTIMSYAIHENRLILNSKALSGIFNLLHSRDQLFMWVYQHHKVVFTDSILTRMIERNIQSN